MAEKYKRISIRFTKKNAWIREELEKEVNETTRPSLNNVVEAILVEYFHKKKLLTPPLKGYKHTPTPK